MHCCNKLTMAACELPAGRCRVLIETLAKNEGFQDFELTVTEACSKGDNYSGELFRVVITGVKNGEIGSFNLIVKYALVTHELEKISWVQEIYRREVFFYATVLPTLDECQQKLPENERFGFAKMYKSFLDEEEVIIIMEDVCVKGYTMSDKMKSYNYEELELCVKSVARLHATSIALKAKKPNVFKELCPGCEGYYSMKSFLGPFLYDNRTLITNLNKNKSYEKVLDRTFDRLLEDYENLFDDTQTNGYSFIIHGDTWSNNILFREKDGKFDKTVFLDWQLMRTGSPVVDLSYILLISIDSRMRCKYYDEMLDLYYGTLSLNVTKMGVDLSRYYPLSVYREQVAKYMKFGFLSSFLILPLVLVDKKTFDDDELYKKDENGKIYEIRSDIFNERMKEVIKDCVDFKII